MNYNKYPEEAKRRHPSLCFQCEKAAKPAALEIAEQGYVGCLAHMDEIKRYQFTDVHQEELASRMLQNGIQCQAAATGWTSAIPVNSDEKRWGIIYNDILLIKGCTKCPYFEPKTKA